MFSDPVIGRSKLTQTVKFLLVLIRIVVHDYLNSYLVLLCLKLPKAVK